MNMTSRVSNPDAQNLRRRNSFMQMDDSDLNHLAGALHSESMSKRQRILNWRLVNVGYKESLSVSRANLRWRRLISPLAAATKNPAVLSPSSRSRSISSITSWGILTVVICDFAFFAPVAIAEIPCVRCISVYARKLRRKDLRCISLWASFKKRGDIHLECAKPGSASTLTGLLTKPLVEVTIMAELKSTQTRPEFALTYNTKFFIWRFMALSATASKVIHITATTEREAREQSPSGCVMVFAGRLPLEVHHA